MTQEISQIFPCDVLDSLMSKKFGTLITRAGHEFFIRDEHRWWNALDKYEFTQGQDIYQRAKRIFGDKGYDPTLSPAEALRWFPDIWTDIAKLEREVFVPHSDGRINFDPDKREKFWVTNQRVGQRLDTERLCADIITALLNDENRVIAHVVDVHPRDVKEVLGDIVLRGGYATNFEDNAPRENNITLALESFDGLVVQPGDTVSFNRVVGPRTRQREYEEAKIIIDGEFVPGVGGGVCQASTTLFNAVLLAGLKIVESHNHSLAISYVPLGRDAMVSSAADFKFKNTTNAPLYIEARVIDKGRINTAQVRIFGAQSEFTYKPRVETRIKPMVTEFVGDVPGLFFTEKVICHGKNARETKTYLDRYRDGTYIDSKYIRKSTYKGKPRIIEYVKPEEIEWTGIAEPTPPL